MTKQKIRNSRPNGRRERKRTAGVGRSVEGAREVRAAGRGDSQCRTHPSSGQRADVYSRVTAEIIAAIEQGAGEWRAPWFPQRSSIARPINVSSAKRYRGINTLALWAAGFAAGYGDGLWGTYKQWQDAGAQVREGERSTTVVFGARSGLPGRTTTKTTMTGIGGCSRASFASQCRSGRRVRATGGSRAAEAKLLAHARSVHREPGRQGLSSAGRKPIIARRPTPCSCRRSLHFAMPRHSTVGWLHETGHASGAKHSSTAIFPGALAQRPMPPRNAASRFSAGSSLQILASPTIRVRSCRLCRFVAQGPEGRPKGHLHGRQQSATCGPTLMHAQQPQAAEEMAA